jgi:hypothetical protein
LFAKLVTQMSSSRKLNTALCGFLKELFHRKWVALMTGHVRNFLAFDVIHFDVCKSTPTG